jgi:hypothetical protein
MAARISEEKLCSLVLDEAGDAERKALENVLRTDPPSQAVLEELRAAARAARDGLEATAPALTALNEEQRRKVLETAGAGRQQAASPTGAVPAAVAGDDLGIEVEVEIEAAVARGADNSDLFSLGNLQTLAARETPSLAPARRVKDEETSGLVDLKALTQSRESNEQVEISELLNLGPGGSAGLAPVVAPEVVERRRNWMIGIAAALAVVVVIGGLIFVLVREAGKPEPVDENEQAIALLRAEIEKLKNSGASEEDLRRAEEQLAEEQAKKEAREAGEPVAVAKAETRPAASKDKKASGSSSKPAAAAKESAPAPAPRPKAGGVAELDDLLGGGGSKPAKKTAPASSGGGGVPDKLSRDQVQGGMQSVAGAVKACGKGAGGTITIRVTIAASGSVTSAKATGPHAGTPVGSCAEKAVKKARFPKAKNKLDVSYPFKL